MKKIDLDEIIELRNKNFLAKKPVIIRKIIISLLKKILYIDKINAFIEKHGHLDSKHFIMEIFDYLNYSFLISDSDLQKIPSEGAVICVANHPSSLDSLVILKAFLELRNDVKIVANDVILNFEYLKDYIIPVDIFNKSFQRKNIELINKALENENAVIIFPAAEVSRLKWLSIKDGKWRNSAVNYAHKFNAPILPVFIDSKNSPLFYLTSIINKSFSTLLLAHEIFNKKNKTTHVVVGDLIPSRSFKESNVGIPYQTKLLRKHIYHLGKKRKKVFTTEKNVIHPVDKKMLKYEVKNSDFIGSTTDGKSIFLTTRANSPNILNEIARLRELTFRKVGEGTGKKLDLDKYDGNYSHLFLWDDANLEIVGSYRIGIGKQIMEKFGINGFYTSSLFNFEQDFIDNVIPYSIELGRSFIQEKYWNTLALDVLWQGIGQFLNKNPQIKYMFGGVSITSNYSNQAMAWTIYYFKKWYSNQNSLALSKTQFIFKNRQLEEYPHLFFGKDSKEDFKILKKLLHLNGYSVAILYKHYSDLCTENGVSFLDFGVDPDFKNCVDGLILVDVTKIKDEKKERYLRTQINEKMVVNFAV